ncbi:hypothetical protein [Aquabacterium humicola]|uniref:hypothetical protein n=1 Tax=Aquabacterium humicola TaxID=3237377 RepID=UPI0025436A37|nr:hypothetical protein [Rubrivivax pictus]
MSSLAAADQVLLDTPEGSDPSALQDVLVSLVYANAAARAASAIGAGSARCGAFISSWVSQLGKQGWVLSAAMRSSMASSSSRPGPAVTLGTAVVAGSADDAATSVMATLQQLVDVTPDDPLVQLWWRTASAVEGCLYTALGAIEWSEAGPVLSLTWLTLDGSGLRQPAPGMLQPRPALALNGPQVLNATVDASTVQVVVRRIDAQLNPQVFAAHRDALRAQLGSKFYEHIAGPATQTLAAQGR